MTRREIQQALKEKGIRQADIAEALGISETAVSLFLRRKFRSQRISRKLDELLGVRKAIR